MKKIIPIDLLDIVKIGLYLSFSALLILFIYMPNSLLFFLCGITFAVFLICIFIAYPRFNFYFFFITLLVTPVVLNFLPGVKGLIFRELPLVILYILGFFRFFAGGTTKIKNIKLGQNEILLIIFFFVMLTQALRQYPLRIGILGFIGVAYYSPIYFIVLMFFDTKERIKKFILFLFYITVGLAIISILQYLFAQRIMSLLGFELGDVAYRTTMGHLKVSSTLGNASAFATIASAIFIIVFFQTFSNVQLCNRKLMGFALVFIGLSIVLSYSRIAWLSLGVVFMISFFFYNRKKIMKVVILGLLILVILNFVFDNSIYNNFISSFGIGENTLGIKSTKERIGIIDKGLSLFAEKPWFGFGLGVTGSPSEHYSHLLKNGIFITDNYYLKLLIETGIIGTFLFLLFLFFSILKGKKIYNKITDEFLKNLSLSLALGLMIFALTSVAASTLELPAVNCLFWVIIGLLSACELEDNECLSADCIVQNDGGNQ